MAEIAQDAVGAVLVRCVVLFFDCAIDDIGR
jgi:hypothetical protein